MAHSPSDILELTRAAFRQEAEDLLSELDTALLQLEGSPTDGDSLNRAFRAMHTLKGSGATAGFVEVSTVVHDVENIFNGARDGRLTITSPIIDLVLKVGDVVRRMLAASRAENARLLDEGMTLVAELEGLVGPASVPPAPRVPSLTGPALDPRRSASAAEEPDLWAIHFAPDARIFHSGNDPLALLRELLALGCGLVRASTDKLFAEADPDPELCYLSWDIQLAAAVSRDEVREVFLFVEDESDLRIERVPVGQAWVLPADAYFEPSTAKDFREEAIEDIAELEAHTLGLEELPFDRERLAGLKRTLHNLKGVSGLMLGDMRRQAPARHPLRAMSELCHAAETYLVDFGDDPSGASSEETSEVLLETVDWLKSLVHAFDDGGDEWPAELLVKLGAASRALPQALPQAPAQRSMLASILSQCQDVMRSIEARRLPDALPSVLDWQMLTRALSTLTKATAFEGAAKTSAQLQAVVALCEAGARGELETSWEEFRDRYRAALSGLDAQATARAPSIAPPRSPSLAPSHTPSTSPSGRPHGRTITLRPSRPPTERPRQAGPQGPAAAAAAQPRSVRIEQAKLDVLMGAIGELLVAKNALPVLVSRVRSSDRQVSKEINETVARIAHIADDLQNAMRQIRMMPIRAAFQRFPRMIRDLARSESKQVQLIISGDDTELDKTVLEQIGDPLVHLVRNAVDHGIELPGQRLAVGKPEQGTVALEVLKEGSNVIIRISDDGRGMDPKRLRAKALEKGLFSDVELAAMSDQAALELIFLPGFSTAEKVTDVSGRGVGMDVVQSNIRQLHGTIALSSELGKGSVMSIKLPSSLMVSKGMLIECGTEQYVLPIEGVREMVKLRREQVRHFRGMAMTSIRGAICPIFSLARLLGLEAESADGTLMTAEESNAVIVSTRSGDLAVLVDRLVAEIDVIVKPLSAGLDKLTMFQGATILGDGSVALILDVGSLDTLVGHGQRALAARALAAADEAARTQPVARAR